MASDLWTHSLHFPLWLLKKEEKPLPTMIPCYDHASKAYSGPVEDVVRNYAKVFAERDQTCKGAGAALTCWFTKVNASGALQAGDLVIFAKFNHVAVATGRGDMVSQSGFVLSDDAKARRLVKIKARKRELIANRDKNRQQKSELAAIEAEISSWPHNRNTVNLKRLAIVYGSFDVFRLKDPKQLNPNGILKQYLPPGAGE